MSDGNMAKKKSRKSTDSTSLEGQIYRAMRRLNLAVGTGIVGMAREPAGSPDIIKMVEDAARWHEIANLTISARCVEAIYPRPNSLHLYDQPRDQGLSPYQIFISAPKVLRRCVVNEHVDVCLVEETLEFRAHSIAKKHKTMIYIDGVPFHQCMYLAITRLPAEDVGGEVGVGTMDEVIQHLKKEHREHETNPAVLTEDEAFWGHLSSIQAWVELDYNLECMDSRLTFPLLKRLAEVGDAKAKRMLDAELESRLLGDSENVAIATILQHGSCIGPELVGKAIARWPRWSKVHVCLLLKFGVFYPNGTWVFHPLSDPEFVESLDDLVFKSYVRDMHVGLMTGIRNKIDNQGDLLAGAYLDALAGLLVKPSKKERGEGNG